ncbi:hypothetical protein DFQ30_003188 [Apophysomyces sp. BC1015]|nr:hypothetical protein DFQ30_003188 [Apophysomyces sp. BC1015]
MMIPEIRLAPPNVGQDTSLEHQNAQGNNQCISPTSAGGRSFIRGNTTCLSDHRSMDSVRPHAEASLSLTGSDHDRRSISIALPVPDHEEARSIPKPDDFINDDLAKQGNIWIGKFLIPAKLFFVVQDVWQTLFPTLQDWGQKSLSSRLSSVVAAPLVLLFTLTLPVAESENIKVDDIEVINDEVLPNEIFVGGNKNYLTVPASQIECAEDVLSIIEEDMGTNREWCQWLLAVQAIFSCLFVFVVMALHGMISSIYIPIGIAIGCVIAATIISNTKADQQPDWYWMLSFVGFAISLNWIFLLANEMVGLLQALGIIFDISDAIMGLTIFAVGNSVGDLVANTAIAKMGFPTMAISACYAGPLLNMVLGVGISSTYEAWKTGKPYHLEVAPTILVSCTGLLIVLLSTLIVVNVNGYRISKGLGWWMIIVYITCCIINVFLEFFILN